MKITLKQLKQVIKEELNETNKKSKIATRKYAIYCNEDGNFWWSTNTGDFGTFSLKETIEWFKEQLELQYDEARGLEEDPNHKPAWYKRQLRRKKYQRKNNV